MSDDDQIIALRKKNSEVKLSAFQPALGKNRGTPQLAKSIRLLQAPKRSKDQRTRHVFQAW